MKKIKNIIFDWSGTLLDDFKMTYGVTRQTIKKLSGHSLSVQEYRDTFQIPVAPFYRRYLKKSCAMKEINDLYFHQLSKKISHARLFEEVPAILRKAHELKMNVSILSTVDQSLLEDMVQAFGLSPYVSQVIGGIKDKVKSLPSVCREYKLKINETLMVGDLVHDIKAAQKAGVMSGAFLCGYQEPSKLLALSPDLVWHDHRGFLKFLNSISLKKPLKKSAQKASKIIPTVGALIFNHEEIFLVQTHKWDHTFGIPGGKIEVGESMEEALCREIQEETGMTIRNIEWALAHHSKNSKEFYKSHQHFLLLNFYAQTRSRKFQLNEEAESGFWISPKAALKLRLNQPTRVLIEYYLQNL